MSELAGSTRRGGRPSFEALEPRLLLDVASVLVGVNENTSLSFVDGDGSNVRLVVGRDGLADVAVEGDGAVNVTVDGRGRATATGTNLRMTTIEMLQSSNRTDLRFGAWGGDGLATLGGIDAAGKNLRHVRGARISLQNGPGLAADSTASITLAAAANTAINVGSTGNLTLGPVDTLTLTATMGRNWLFRGDVVDMNMTVEAVRMLRFLGIVDPSNLQVTIEARIVEFRDDVIATGIDFAFVAGNVRFGGQVGDSTVALGFVDGAVQFREPLFNTPVIIGQAVRGVQFDGLFGSDTTIDQARSIRANWVSGGVHDFGLIDTSVTLRALQGNVQVNILSAPRVTVRESQDATIDVLQTDRFTVQKRLEDTGVTLNVVPVISLPDTINMDLQVQRTDILNIRGGVNGGTITVSDQVGRKATINGPVTGATIDMNVVRSLQFRNHVLNSVITVADGQMLAVGSGRSHVEDSEINVPLLGHLRVLGRLFRNNTIRTDTATLILITPRIVDSTIDPISLGSLVLRGGMTNSVAVSDTFTGRIQVGDMVDSVIFSGVDLGVDELFNTGDETWKPGHVASFVLRGQMSGSSLLGVGVNPGIDGLFFTGDDVGLGGDILSIRFGSYEAGGGGAPADAYGVIAAESIAPFTANGNVIAVTEGAPFVDGDFNVAVTGV